jgi:NADH-quinone oxidoreductase subunit C
MADEAAATEAADQATARPEEPELHGCPLSSSRGQAVLHVPRSRYLEVLRALLADGYEMCVDVTAADYLLADEPRVLPAGVVAERFEVVVNLLDMRTPARLRVRVQLPAGEAVLPSLFDLWPGTEAMEREVFDMFGIRFEGHPDLTRILMPEDWVGHPLRKDYDMGRIPVQFKAAPEGR